MRDMIDGNMIALNRYEREIERQEALCDERNEFITWVSDAVQEVVSVLRNPEDLQDLEDLSEIMDDAIEQLEDLIGKLEGER